MKCLRVLRIPMNAIFYGCNKEGSGSKIKLTTIYCSVVVMEDIPAKMDVEKGVGKFKENSKAILFGNSVFRTIQINYKDMNFLNGK